MAIYRNSKTLRQALSCIAIIALLSCSGKPTGAENQEEESSISSSQYSSQGKASSSSDNDETSSAIEKSSSSKKNLSSSKEALSSTQKPSSSSKEAPYSTQKPSSSSRVTLSSSVNTSSSSAQAPTNHAPDFDLAYDLFQNGEKVFNALVLENEPVGTVIATIKAKDPDGDKITLTDISSTRSGPMFDLKSIKFDALTGTITSTVVFDAESPPPLLLSYEVSDGELKDTLIVMVGVLDKSEFEPKFATTESMTDFPLGNPKGTQIITNAATDVDNHYASKDWTMNYQILEGNADGYFAMNEKGVLSFAKALDASTPQKIVIEADDGTSTATFTMHLAVTSSFVDSRDGKTYATVRVNNLTWMAQDLDYSANNTVGYCLGYTNSHAQESSCTTTSRHYSWAEAGGILCPTGWRMPSATEWGDLRNFADSIYNEVTDWADDKSEFYRAASGWDAAWHQVGYDSFGFAIKGNGFRGTYDFGMVSTFGWSGDQEESRHWTSTPSVTATKAFYAEIWIGTSFRINEDEQTALLSVRCVQD